MGRFASILHIFLTGIALGMNFIDGLSAKSVTYVLLSLFLLNLVVGRDLAEKTNALSKEVIRNVGLHQELDSLKEYMESQRELGKQVFEKYFSPKNLSE